MLWWLLDVLNELLGDPRVQVVFTTVDGSVFSDGVRDAIATAGGRLAPWAQSTQYRFDLAIAASHRGELSRLRCPLVITPHGAGFGKRISMPGSAGVPTPEVGDDPRPATTVMLTHASQQRDWPTTPGTRFVVAGDPSFDALQASTADRSRHRQALGLESGQRLVVVSSTWGPGALLARFPTLPDAMLAQLNVDDWAVAAVLHPNIWTTHGAWQIRSWLRRAREGGLRLLPPHAGWHSALVAADIVIGDHGSVTFYGAALGIPVLLAAFDEDEVTPRSPVAELGRRAPHWNADRSADRQLSNVGRRDPQRYADLAERNFAHVGRALERYREVIYELLTLPPPAQPPRLLTVAPARPEFRAPDALLVAVSLPVERHGPDITLRRLPAAVNPEPPAADADLHLAVAADHADLLLRQSSAVLTADAPCEPANAVRWGRAVLAELPGARIATAPAIDGTVTAVTRDGIYALQAQKPLAPALAGSALYAAITGPWTEPPDRLDVDLGARRVEVMIRPLRGPDAHG